LSIARRLALLLAGLALTACATLPPAQTPGRDRLTDFTLEARFALRLNQPGSPPESAGGRLFWEHRGDGDRILIANPIGVGIAEIDATPALSRLKTADGAVREAEDADALMLEATGERLPVARLPAWLLGRGGPDGVLEVDAQQRPLRLTEDAWQIDYVYDDFAADTLPARITLRRADVVELRLRVEAWREAP
jgi:outer membrane lipoprotein LolB